MIDKTAILSEIYRRNAVRKEAGLPLLDVRQEFKKAHDVARQHEWYAFVDSKQDDVERIRAEVLAEYRAQHGTQFPSSSLGHMAIVRATNDRFKAFAEVHYGVMAPEFNHGDD